MKRHYAPRSPSTQLGVQLIPVLGRESSVEEGLATLAIVAAVACQKAAAANFGTYDRFTTEFIEAFKDASRLVAEASNG
jgi:hypothetical protein